MSSLMVAWCPTCEVFFLGNQNAIGGDGGNVIVTGTFLFPCPGCGGIGTSPGGQFRLEQNALVRVSDNLSKTQAEELKSRLARLKDQGYSITTLKELVQSYAPQLLTYLQSLDEGDPTRRINWRLLVFFLLWQIAHNVTLDIKVDIRTGADQLVGQAVKQANEENTRSISDTPSPRAGRNDPCPCGSGKKYKKCCGK
ncbi:MAG: SEC-C metal-binding domain-containing protein [Planctomycetia bacterium]|nr:SEC-C metal-binding domain-containing protein [Planctomycetia bacterium]